MRKVAVSLVVLAAMALAAGTAVAGGMSYPMAAHLGGQTVAHPYGGCYGGGPVVAYYPNPWYGPAFVGRPCYPPPWYRPIVRPPHHHGGHHGGHYGPHGGLQWRGRGFAFSIGF